jgi:hypothetical protein
MCEIPITTAYKTVASVVYGLYLQAQPGLVLKYGAVVAMAVAHVVANSLQWAADPAATLEKQLELLRATHIEYVLAVQAAALRHVKVLQDFLAMWSIPLRPHTQLACVPAVATVATAHVFIQ